MGNHPKNLQLFDATENYTWNFPDQFLQDLPDFDNSKSSQCMGDVMHVGVDVIDCLMLVQTCLSLTS